eukprot:4724581-Pyramimonas_sp.AAC.1
MKTVLKTYTRTTHFARHFLKRACCVLRVTRLGRKLQPFTVLDDADTVTSPTDFETSNFGKTPDGTHDTRNQSHKHSSPSCQGRGSSAPASRRGSIDLANLGILGGGGRRGSADSSFLLGMLGGGGRR